MEGLLTDSGKEIGADRVVVNVVTSSGPPSSIPTLFLLCIYRSPPLLPCATARTIFGSIFKIRSSTASRNTNPGHNGGDDFGVKRQYNNP